MPKFSIITASYNYEEYIKETIESVINQTLPHSLIIFGRTIYKREE